MLANTMLDLLLLGTIGKICLKSAPKTIDFSPKGSSIEFSMSCHMISPSVQLRASKQCLCTIRASSQIISIDLLKSLERSIPWSMLQVKF